jgi:G3E family GTPase
VITVVDGVQGKAQTSKYEEAIFQIVQADIGLISKSDLISFDHLNQLRNFLNQINPTLVIEVVEHGRINPALLFSDLVKCPSYPILGEDKPRHKSHHHTMHDIASRHNDIASWSLIYEKPLDEVKLRDWLSMIYSLRPYALLRMKGIIKLANSDRPMLLQAVGNVVAPPTWLERWPNSKEETQLVLIFKGLSKEALTKSFYRHVLS